MTLTIEVVFECAGEREASALEAVLGPDNHSLPRDLLLSSSRSGARLRFRVSSTRRTTCVSSASSLVSDAKLFAEVWRTAS